MDPGGAAAAGMTSDGRVAAAAAAGNGPFPTPGFKKTRESRESLEWSPQDLALLKELLTRYASVPNPVRYAMISAHLPCKTVRGVTLQCQLMTVKGTDPSEKPSTYLAAQPRVSSHALPILPLNAAAADDISYEAIGGAAGELLMQNAQALSQISTNIDNHQIHDNINLFCIVWDNLLRLQNDLGLNSSITETPMTIKRMPPLPESINEGLLKDLLQWYLQPMQS